ncbi:hypothetical protein [Lewinella cohaerens]|uniref:hypothetical protein n=1 Tax=Lewinella cohaerens TaxID=70995 RepID=UPI00037B2D08|nr:hypothetical protein [Lewinella cohaerens]
MKTILLRVNNQGVYYNPTEGLAWASTNLPVGAFRFREHEPIYWRVSMCAYQKETQLLEVEVLDYEAAFMEGFEKQSPRQPISALQFRPLSPQAFKANLSYYDGLRLATILANTEPEPPAPKAIWTKPREGWEIEMHRQPTDPSPPPLEKLANIHLHFQERIQDLSFSLGMIKGTHYVEEWGITIDYEIVNDFIIPEFDYVKSYVAKALKQRRVSIEIKTTLADAIGKSVPARSPILQNIDERLLVLVRSQAVGRLLKKPKFEADVDKSLFTADEMYDQYTEDGSWGDALRSPGEEILAQILSLKKVRNAKQLQFLAGKVHAPGEKLRFTLTPLFGFIFLAQGERQQHFIWELLNSHATYLWSFDPQELPAQQRFPELEKILNFIKIHGRQEYRNNNHLSDHFAFRAINHRHAGSNFVDGFPRWRNLLLEQLV